jgi:hypothetical protein
VPLNLFVRVRSDTRSDSFDREGASDDASDGEIFENCIEKNFHVPNMRAAIIGLFPCPLVVQFRESRNELGHTGGYLGSTGDEGRAKLRKA